MDINALIGEILRRRSDLTREEILKRAEERREKIPHISPYTSVLLVAVDLGIKLSLDIPSSTELGKLVEGLNSITVRGRVLWVKGEKGFARKAGGTGSFVRAGLGDRTGIVDVIFWDRSPKDLEDRGFVEGGIVELSSARTRKSLAGVVEIHVGPEGKVEALKDKEGYPALQDFLTPLSEISPGQGRGNTFGRVMNEPIIKKFSRVDGGEGLLMRFRIAHGDVVRSVAVWNDVVEDYRWIKPSLVVAIFNARVKVGLNGEAELHIGKTSHIAPLSVVSETPSMKPSLLKDLAEGYNAAKIYLRVDAIGLLKTSTTKKPVISFHALDPSGDAVITLIGGLAERVERVEVGTTLSLEGVRLKKRGEELYILCDDSSRLEMEPQIPRGFEPPQVRGGFTSLSEVSIFLKVVNVKGLVVKEAIEEPSQIPNYSSRGEFYLEEGGRLAKITYRNTITDYIPGGIRVNDEIKILGAAIHPPSFLETPHYINLRLKAFSRIVKD